MFYLILNCDLPEFKNVIIAFETCFTIMLNKFDFGKIKVSPLRTIRTHLKTHTKWTGDEWYCGADVLLVRCVRQLDPGQCDANNYY